MDNKNYSDEPLLKKVIEGKIEDLERLRKIIIASINDLSNKIDAYKSSSQPNNINIESNNKSFINEIKSDFFSLEKSMGKYCNLSKELKLTLSKNKADFSAINSNDNDNDKDCKNDNENDILLEVNNNKNEADSILNFRNVSKIRRIDSVLGEISEKYVNLYDKFSKVVMKVEGEKIKGKERENETEKQNVELKLQYSNIDSFNETSQKEYNDLLISAKKTLELSKLMKESINRSGVRIDNLHENAVTIDDGLQLGIKEEEEFARRVKFKNRCFCYVCLILFVLVAVGIIVLCVKLRKI